MPGEQPGVGVRGPRRHLCPPPGKLLHNSFVFFHQPGRAAEPRVRMPGCGPGCSWGAGSGGQLRLGGARGNGKFVRSASSAWRSRPKPPHALGTRLELGPRLGCMHSPLTPDTQAAGDRGPGRGRPSGWLRVETSARASGPEDGSQGACLGRGLPSGLLELAALRGRTRRDRPPERSRGTQALPAWGLLDMFSCPTGWTSAGRTEFSETLGEWFGCPALAWW